MSDFVLILKVLLKLTSIWGPAFLPWFAALVSAESTGSIHNLAHKRTGVCNSREEKLSNLQGPGRPRPTDIIHALSDQLLDLQCRLREAQQFLTALAAQVRQNETASAKTEAA